MNCYSGKRYFGWACGSSPGPGLTLLSLLFENRGTVSILQPAATKTRCFSGTNLSLGSQGRSFEKLVCLFVCFNKGERKCT